MLQPPRSPAALVWRRFCRNRLAVCCLALLVVALLVALLGYGIAPDPTPDANRQLPDIALQRPGYRVQLLPVYLQQHQSPQNQSSQNWLARCAYGT